VPAPLWRKACGEAYRSFAREVGVVTKKFRLANKIRKSNKLKIHV